jgi:hypothetical protein
MVVAMREHWRGGPPQMWLQGVHVWEVLTK